MKFNSLKEKCEYFRSLTDYRLTPNSYVIAMLDGHTFSKLVKKKYKLPFDERFMGYMNKTAEYICKKLQGVKLAYVQSDEISLLITDFDTPDTDAPFGYRICKLQSLLAGMASAKFNQLVAIDMLKDGKNNYEDLPFSNAWDDIEIMNLVEFDCKVWTVPGYNEAFCHFLWRQNDCTKNSKQQSAQTYLSFKELQRKNADQQIALMKERYGVDWHDYTDGEKYGRLIYRENMTFYDEVSGTEFVRSPFVVHDATPFNSENSIIKTLIPRKHE